MWMVGVIFMFVAFVVMPYLLVWLLTRNKVRFTRKLFTRKFGILLSGVRFKSKWNVAYFFVFIMRRIIFTIAFGVID